MKQWYAVIGDPVAHSKSPLMHTAWFEQAGIDAAYIPIHVKAHQLADAVRSLKLLGASGFNVTVPHKTAIMPLLDAIDPLAQAAGAVNTVARSAGGRLTGYNTDGAGFLASLPTVPKPDVPVLLLGAGGAARGIAAALKFAGHTRFAVANRSADRAEALCASLGAGDVLTLKEAGCRLSEFALIIQTTPVGMVTSTQSPLFEKPRFTPGSIVADIVYNPLETAFLREASQQGAIAINGLGMFVRQGALAFARWTGIEPDALAMERALLAKERGTPHVDE